MKVSKTTQHTISTYKPDGVTYEDNRFMWVSVDAVNPIGYLEVGDKVNIGNIRSVVRRGCELEVLGIMTFTVTSIRCGEIQISPSIVSGGEYINASGIACEGDEMTLIDEVGCSGCEDPQCQDCSFDY